MFYITDAFYAFPVGVKIIEDDKKFLCKIREREGLKISIFMTSTKFSFVILWTDFYTDNYVMSQYIAKATI